MIGSAALVATPLLAVIALEDLRRQRIRNRHVAALAAFTAIAIALAAQFDDPAVLHRAALGAGLAAAPLAATWVAQPGRLGGGDVKLAATLGALVGAANPWLGLAVVAVGLVASLAVAITRRLQRVPLAPGLILAAVVVVAFTA